MEPLTAGDVTIAKEALEACMTTGLCVVGLGLPNIPCNGDGRSGGDDVGRIAP